MITIFSCQNWALCYHGGISYWSNISCLTIIWCWALVFHRETEVYLCNNLSIIIMIITWWLSFWFIFCWTLQFRISVVRLHLIPLVLRWNRVDEHVLVWQLYESWFDSLCSICGESLLTPMFQPQRCSLITHLFSGLREHLEKLDVTDPLSC